MVQNQNWSRVMVFGLLVAVGLGLGLLVNSLDPQQDEAYLVVIGGFLVIAVPAFAILITLFLRTGWSGGGTRHLSTSLGLIQAGHASAVIDRSLARRREGDDSPENALVLAMAYTHQGRGARAESFAREGLDAVGEDGYAWLRDLGHIALYQALLVRGAFAEAADAIRDHTPVSFDRAFVQVLTAWAHFLDADEAAARSVLEDVPPTGSLRRRLSPKYLVVLLHMRHVLTGDPPPDRADYADELAEWEQDAGRNAHAPYGQRLRAVLGDLRGDAPGDGAPGAGAPGDSVP